MTSPASVVAEPGPLSGAEDLARSPLWNPDLAPTPPERRTWSTYNIAALWIGMSVVITTYTLASGFMSQGMSWWHAMVTILLGNTVVLIPMVLNAHAGTKYGISFPVLCRASFGVRGANLPAILRAIVACGWFGIQTWIGGLALDALCLAAWSGWTGVPGHTAIAFLVFWLIQVGVIFKGTEGIKLLESWSAPLLLAGGGLLLLWATRAAGGLGRLLAESERLRGGGTSFWALFPSALTASVGYWATLSLNIPDFTRYAKSQRSQMLGQALGLPTTMTAFAFIGVAVTSATIVVFGEAIWDPVVLIARIGSPAVIVFGALVVLVAQLTTNMAANVVSPANDFSNLSPKRISYVTGGLITAVIGILMFPWKLYSDAAAYIFTWLLGYSSLMGALGGILIADYWIVRRQRLVLADLFREQGAYTYRGGVNPRAIAAFVIAILPVIPGFARAVVTPGGTVADPNLFDRLYAYAWFVTFGLSFVVYLGLMRTGRSGPESPGESSRGVKDPDMPRLVKCGLIQATHACSTAEKLETIREANLAKHMPLIERAGREGVQILCMQEIFTGPYFCAEQSTRWYDAVEAIPDGPTTRLMQEVARRHGMVIVVPLYEEDGAGIYYNTAAVIDADGTYLGKYRKNHIPHCAPGFWEKFYFRPGNLGYPVFKTRYADVGVYICYDRHFPEGARELGLNGAEIVFNPSATVAGLSEYLWRLEQPAHAVANAFFVGAINRVGYEDPWRIGEFYGQSYFCNPRGQIVAEGARDRDELVTAELDLDQIREVRNVWQFYRDRRPETYVGLTRL